MLEANATPPPKNLFLTIRTPQEVIFQENVTSVSAFNRTGPFDVLTGHAYFISIIEKYIVIQELNGTRRRLEIDTAVMQVEENTINIYLEGEYAFRQ